MGRHDETHEDSHRVPDLPLRAEPGVVVLFASGRPAARGFEVGAGFEIGRGTPDGLLEQDDRVSRSHVRVRRRDGLWVVEDLDSRNGTIVNGRKLEGSASFEARALIRIGRSLLVTVDDVRPFLAFQPGPPGGPRTASDEGPVIGALLAKAYGEIALASRAGDTLCVVGESGAGKELAAHAFHDARHGTASGAPFVAVNCAAIPEGLAERLLFGARKGAYSGAVADVDGYLQSADGGTLFLDEIAELDLLVQAKLLRVLETHEVLALGASRPKRVTFSVCVASHEQLREEVAEGRFREDLYFRVGRPEVRLPALRERPDEIPRFLARELRAVDPRLTPAVSLVEACALRPWPGNVRELLREVRRAGYRALGEAAGRAEHDAPLVVEAEHLPSEAGEAITRSRPPGESNAPHATGATGATGASDTKVDASRFTDEDIERTLAENAGNVRGTARALGMHRNQLRRWLEKKGIATPPGAGSTAPPEDD